MNVRLASNERSLRRKRTFVSSKCSIYKVTAYLSAKVKPRFQGADALSVVFIGQSKPSKIRFNTTVAEISRLAASGMTIDCGLSITSSVTIIFRRTGKQCIK